MSDKKEPVDEIKVLEEQFAKDAELERLQDEVSFKKAKLDKEKYDQLFEELEQNKKELEIAKGLDFGSMTTGQIDSLQQDFDEYIKAAKNKFKFLNSDFDRVVPFFRKNLILVAAHTGKGKSTVAANIAASILQQKNPTTGKSGRCLIMTNEERAEDFFARVACLLLGWNYVNHNELTNEQVTAIKSSMNALGKRGLLTIVDNTYGGINGMTTTIEGIESVFENLIAKKEYYDVIIIDYYQNIISSKNDIYMDENRAQMRLAKMLEQYKNMYPAPIVLMAQCDPETDRDHRVFKQRVNGRKIISDGTTFAVELTVDYDLHTTEWTVWKSRYTQFIGKSIFTGFENGKYVKCDDAFRRKVQEQRDKAALKELDRQTGVELKEKMEESK